MDTCPLRVNLSTSGHDLIFPIGESDDLSSDGPVLMRFLCVCNCTRIPTYLSASACGLHAPDHVNSYAHRPTRPLPRQLVYTQANASPPMSVYLHVVDRSPTTSTRVRMQATRPQPPQCVCTQANTSTRKQMHFQSRQRVWTQCKRVSGHVRTSVKQANASPATPTRLQASRRVPGHQHAHEQSTCPPMQ